jgi:hypothetical protein
MEERGEEGRKEEEGKKMIVTKNKRTKLSLGETPKGERK